MKPDDFRKYGHKIVDWMADYLDEVESYPVKSLVKPGEILDQLPIEPPQKGESFGEIFSDFNSVVMPGMTHWQHPCFFAYFPANSSRISVLAEMLTSTLGAQCMIWQTSPAAAELEERVMEWLVTMTGLPRAFTGVIQDTASTSTLCSILTAREAASNFNINRKGFDESSRYTLYCSNQTHSSIEKAVKIAGLGKENLRLVDVDDKFAMIPDKLEEAIKRDIENGLEPLLAVATIGTTSSVAVDPIDEIGDICTKYRIWLHVDAAYGGTGLLLPENRWMIKGVEKADTFVFNPHKWMFTNFDCSAYFVKDPSLLVRTFEILPEYLKTREGDRVNNYRDWGIPLGRRFRALKLWFVIRNYGIEGLQKKVRNHIDLAKSLAKKMEDSGRYEILAPIYLSTVCFRYKPVGLDDEMILNRINKELIEKLNDSGVIYLTHTILNGIYTIRFMIGQTETEERHVTKAWDLIEETASAIKVR